MQSAPASEDAVVAALLAARKSLQAKGLQYMSELKSQDRLELPAERNVRNLQECNSTACGGTCKCWLADFAIESGFASHGQRATHHL